MKVAIVYDALPAGRRALGTVQRLVEVSAEPIHVIPELWRFNVLADQAIRREALRSAQDADLLVIAAERSNEIPPAVESWVDDLITLRRGEPVTILAMGRAGDDWTVSFYEPTSTGAGEPAIPAGSGAEPRRAVAA